MKISIRWPFFGKKKPTAAVAEANVAQPPAQDFWAELSEKTWVRIIKTDELAVLDHVKPNRQYGVRPVDVVHKSYFPSHWEHWPDEMRWKWPREYSMGEDEFVVLSNDEVQKIINQK